MVMTTHYQHRQRQTMGTLRTTSGLTAKHALKVNSSHSVFALAKLPPQDFKHTLLHSTSMCPFSLHGSVFSLRTCWTVTVHHAEAQVKRFFTWYTGIVAARWLICCSYYCCELTQMEYLAFFFFFWFSTGSYRAP